MESRHHLKTHCYKYSKRVKPEGKTSTGLMHLLKSHVPVIEGPLAVETLQPFLSCCLVDGYEEAVTLLDQS